MSKELKEVIIVCNALNAMYVEGVESNKKTHNRFDLKYLLSCQRIKSTLHRIKHIHWYICRKS